MNPTMTNPTDHQEDSPLDHLDPATLPEPDRRLTLTATWDDLDAIDEAAGRAARLHHLAEMAELFDEDGPTPEPEKVTALLVTIRELAAVLREQLQGLTALRQTSVRTQEMTAAGRLDV